MWSAFRSQRISNKPKFLAIAGAVACYKMAEYGGGKHIYDPIFRDMANLKGMLAVQQTLGCDRSATRVLLVHQAEGDIWYDLEYIA